MVREMTTKLEKMIELEDLIEEEAKKRFPAMDPKWFTNRHMERLEENSRQTAKILMLMRPEILRVLLKKER